MNTMNRYEHAHTPWLAAIAAACTGWLLASGCAASKETSSKAATSAPGDNDMDGIPDMADTAGEGLAKKAEMAADDMAVEEKAVTGKDKPKGGKDKKTWKRSTLVANTSQLKVGDHETLPIRGMQVHARVDGFRARVLIDFWFENPHARQYEGTFQLRLPTGASPYFLAFGQEVVEERPPSAEPERPVMLIAMDESRAVRAQGFEPSQVMVARAPHWQKPREARMVPREQAAFAYKSTVRRRVDPALMEWAGAGVFNARIFPIAPRRLHRVVVGYDINLTRVGADLQLSLPVPKDIPKTAVDLDVAALDGVRIAVTPTRKGERDGERVYYRFDDVSGKELQVRMNGVGAVALVGDDPQTGPYFAARVAPDVPSMDRNAGTASGRAVFLIDTSLSSNPERFPIWLSLSRAILDRNRGRGLDRFAVAFFNIETHWWQSRFVDNTAENAAALLSYADGLALEGATDLGAALREGAHPSWLGQKVRDSHDLFLLSDGAITWGESDAFALSSMLRGKHSRAGALYAYRTGMTGDDASMLSHLSRETGGAVFSVVGESEIPQAAVAHTRRPWYIDSIGAPGGQDVLIAGRPQALFPGQQLFVAGRGSPTGALTLELSQAGAHKTVSIPIPHRVTSPGAARAYGQIAVGQLEEFLGFSDSFAEAYARHFRVTGKTTSLLMLESEEDYRRFGIRPQNDVGLIKASLATDVIAKALGELAQVLGDAKFAFLERTAKKLRLSDEVRALLAGLPGDRFQVDVPPLVTKQRGKQGMSTALRKQLMQRKPEYDTVTDDAARRMDAYGPADGLKSLSSLVEANPGDSVLARDIGYTAMQWGLHAHAYYLFQRVARARPFEPQTFRALAQTLAEMGKPDLALAYFEIAMQGQWDRRFGEFQRIVTVEYLRFLRRSQDRLHERTAAFARKRRTELEQSLGIGHPDLLVTITWNTDNTDVDLHVIEPSGEECYYSHNRTRTGGELTQDVTQGYGPEMYILESAPRGTYRVRAKYFASDSNRASARTKVYVSVYRHFGESSETVHHKVVALAYGKEMHEVFKVDVK